MNFKVGDKVYYFGPELVPFGTGVVSQIEGVGRSAMLTVEWRVVGVKCHEMRDSTRYFRKESVE